jgi:DNA replication protein DnaC
MRPIADVLASMPRPQRHEEVYRPPEIPVCPICQGAGWLRMDVPLGHPSFGRLFKCECGKHSEERIRLAEMRRLSQLDGLEGKTFESFEADGPELQRAIAVARAFAASLDGWLVLSGQCGTGKTHIAAAIANQTLAVANQTVMFAVVPDLLDHLRATFEPSRGIDYDDRFNKIRNTFLLVLDDLGTENTTPWAREKLYQIVNHRYNERLPTVITTNQPDSAIDERILSRMLDRSLSDRLNFTGDDYRRRGDPTYTRGRKRPGR